MAMKPLVRSMLIILVVLFAAPGETAQGKCFDHQVRCSVFCKDWLYDCVDISDKEATPVPKIQFCCRRNEAYFAGIISAIVISILVVISFVACAICYFVRGCPIHDWLNEPVVPHIHHHPHATAAIVPPGTNAHKAV